MGKPKARLEEHRNLMWQSKWFIGQRINVLIDATMWRTWLLTLDAGRKFPDVRIVILRIAPPYREHEVSKDELYNS